MYKRKAEVMIWLVFVIVLLSSTVYAQDPSVDYNQLTPQELALAIDGNLVADWSAVWPGAIGNAIKHNTAIVNNVPNPYLANTITNDISLMDKNEVFTEVDKRAQQNPSILNDNSDIKSRWFKASGITDFGAKIKKYDGNQLTTLGSHSTTFLLSNHPGAEVWKDGSLHLLDKTVVWGGKVEVDPIDNLILVINGKVDLSKNPTKIMKIKDSKITDGKLVYVSSGTAIVDRRTDKTTVEGDVSVFKKSKMMYKVEGIADFFSDNQIVLRKPTSGTTTLSRMGIGDTGGNSAYRIYTVTKDTDYYEGLSGQQLKDIFTKGPCKTKSCIVVSNTLNTRIASRNNNEIMFSYLDGLMPSLKVETIKDNSKVDFYDVQDKEGKMVTTAFFFSKKPVTYAGKLTDSRTSIVNSWIDENGIERTYILSSGHVMPGSFASAVKIEMRNGKTKIVGEGTSDKHALATAETRARLLRMDQFPHKVKAVFFVNTDFPGTINDFPIFARDIKGNPIKTIDGKYVYYFNSDDKKYSRNPQYTEFPPPDIQMREMLMKMGVPANNIKIVLNSKKQRYMKELRSYSNSIKDGDTPFIFSSSHGMDDQTEGLGLYGFSTTDDSEFGEDMILPGEFASATKNLNKHFPIHMTDQCFGGGFNNAIRAKGSTAFTIQAATSEQTATTSAYYVGAAYVGLMYSPEDFLENALNDRDVKKIISKDRQLQKSIQLLRNYYKEAIADGHLSLFERRVIADSAYPILNKVEATFFKRKTTARGRPDAESTGKYGTVSLNLVRGYHVAR